MINHFKEIAILHLDFKTTPGESRYSTFIIKTLLFYRERNVELLFFPPIFISQMFEEEQFMNTTV